MTSQKYLEKHMNSNIRSLMTGGEKVEIDKAPSSLLTYNRLDVVVKYLYAKSKLNDINSTFIKNLYLRHIQNINGFVEADDTDKIGPSSFLDSFDKMISTVENVDDNKKFFLPINEEGQILDGAHRLSIALVHGMNRIDTILVAVPGQVYDYKFFKDGSLSEAELDLIVHEYCKIKSQTRGVLIWPIAKSKDVDSVGFLEKFGKIIYSKEIELDFTGLVQLIRIAYKDEPWVGTTENNFLGAHNKARWCSKDGNNLTFVIFEPNDGVDIVSIKESLRENYGLDKHSMHINDTASETMELCELLLNENSINWMNTSNLAEFTRFEELLSLYKKVILGGEQDKDDFIVLGSLLAAYGVKDSLDLDYMNTGHKRLSFISDELELDLGKMKWIKTEVSELLSDPKHFYYYRGFKFLSVDDTYEFKSRRRRDQDLEDLRILSVLKNKQRYRASARLTLKKLSSFRFYKLKLKYLVYLLRFISYRTIGNLRGLRRYSD